MDFNEIAIMRPVSSRWIDLSPMGEIEMEPVDDETDDDDEESTADSDELKFRSFRLGVISLRKVNQLFDKNCFEQYGGDVKILWKITKNIMEKAFGKFETDVAFHLLRNLFYFESSELEYKMFSKSYPPKYLSILASCGLIDIVFVINDNDKLCKLIKLENPGTKILEPVIREENESNEQANLTECFKILKEYQCRIPLETRKKYYLGLWKNALKFEKLVKSLVEDDGSPFRNFEIICCDRDPEEYDSTLIEIITTTIERVEEVIGEFNNLTFVLRLYKMKMILGSDEYSNRFKLDHWKELVGFYEKNKYKNGLGWCGCTSVFPFLVREIGQHMYKMGLNDRTISEEEEVKTEFLEESLRAFTMVWEHLKKCSPSRRGLPLNYDEIHTIWLGMFKCLKILKKYDQTSVLLIDIYEILLSEENSDVIHKCLFGFCSSWIAIFNEVIHYDNKTKTGLSGLKFLMIWDLGNLIKFIFDYVICELRKWPSKFGIKLLLQVAYAYFQCLTLLKDYDQFLLILQKSNEICKDILEVKFPVWDNLTVSSRVNLYFDFQKTLFKIIREKGVEIGSVQDKILMESIEFSKSIVKKVFQIEGRGEPMPMTHDDYHTVGPSHIIACYIYLGRTDEVILYSSDYRQLIFEKYGINNDDFAIEWIMYLENLCVQIDSAPVHVNGQVLALPESIESWAQECLEETIKKIENKLVKSVLKEKAENLIKFCEKRIRDQERIQGKCSVI